MKIRDVIVELQRQDPNAEFGFIVEGGGVLGDDYFNRGLSIVSGFIEKDPELNDWSGTRIRKHRTKAASFEVFAVKKW